MSLQGNPSRTILGGDLKFVREQDSESNKCEHDAWKQTDFGSSKLEEYSVHMSKRYFPRKRNAN